jgi:hypothetical protein
MGPKGILILTRDIFQGTEKKTVRKKFDAYDLA